MLAGNLNWRVQILRSAPVDDGLQSRKGEPMPLGVPIWATRKDASDGEMQRMGQEIGTLMARFVVRRDSFTNGITAADFLRCDGQLFEISGIKQTDGMAALEITARAKVA